MTEKCFTCCTEITDHRVAADGDVFCSQGCARMAGIYETEPCELCEGPRGIRGTFGLRTTSPQPAEGK